MVKNTYTIERGVVRVNKVFDGVEENEEGENNITSDGILVAGAKRVSFMVEGFDLDGGKEATLKIRTSIDGGDTYRLHKYLIDTSSPTNGIDYTSEIEAHEGNKRKLGYLAPETLGAVTHLTARLEIEEVGSGSFDVVVTVQN